MLAVVVVTDDNRATPIVGHPWLTQGYVKGLEFLENRLVGQVVVTDKQTFDILKNSTTMQRARELIVLTSEYLPSLYAGPLNDPIPVTRVSPGDYDIAIEIAKKKSASGDVTVAGGAALTNYAAPKCDRLYHGRMVFNWRETYCLEDSNIDKGEKIRQIPFEQFAKVSYARDVDLNAWFIMNEYVRP